MDYNISYREKNKSIQCIISYKDNNGEWKTKSKQGFRIQKDAKPWIEKTVEELENQLKNELKLDQEYRDITFKEFSEIFINDLLIYKEYGTVEAHGIVISKFHKLNELKLKDIKFMDIQGIVNDMIKEGMKPSTIKEYTSKIRKMFNKAIKPYKVIISNPIDDAIQIPADKENERVKALNKSEVDMLLKVMKPEKDYMISLIALTTGLRIGEIIGLTLDNVDLDNGKIKVVQQWKKLSEKKYGFGTLKSKNSYREVPIPPSTVVEIKKYLSSAIIGYDKRIFPEKTTNNACFRLGRKYKRLGFDISIHDLRHTYATMLIANGLDFKTIAQLLGHTVQMTIKTYSHVNTDMMDNAKNKINAIF